MKNKLLMQLIEGTVMGLMVASALFGPMIMGWV